MGNSCSCIEADEQNMPAPEYPCRGAGAIKLFDMMIPSSEHAQNPYYFGSHQQRAEHLSSSAKKRFRERCRLYRKSPEELRVALREELLSGDCFKLITDCPTSTASEGGYTGGLRREKQQQEYCTQTAYVYQVGTSGVLDAWFQHFQEGVLTSLARRESSSGIPHPASHGVATTRLDICKEDIRSLAPCVGRLLDIESRRSAAGDGHPSYITDDVYARYLFSLVAPGYLEIEAAFSYITSDAVSFPQPLSAVLGTSSSSSLSALKITTGPQLVRLMRLLVSGVGDTLLTTQSAMVPTDMGDLATVRTLLQTSLKELPGCLVTHPSHRLSVLRPNSAGLSSNTSRLPEDAPGEDGIYSPTHTPPHDDTIDDVETTTTTTTTLQNNPSFVSTWEEIRVMSNADDAMPMAVDIHQPQHQQVVEEDGGSDFTDEEEEDNIHSPPVEPLSVPTNPPNPMHALTHPNSIASYDWPTTIPNMRGPFSASGTAGGSVCFDQMSDLPPSTNHNNMSKSRMASTMRPSKFIELRKFLPSLEHVLFAIGEVYTAGEADAFLQATPTKAVELATLTRAGWRKGWCYLGATTWDSALLLARNAFQLFEMGSTKDERLVVTMKFVFSFIKSIGCTNAAQSPLWEAVEYAEKLEAWHISELEQSTKSAHVTELTDITKQRLKDRESVRSALTLAVTLRKSHIHPSPPHNSEDAVGTLIAAQLISHLLQDKWAALPQWISFILELSNDAPPSPRKKAEAPEQPVKESDTPPKPMLRLTRKTISSDVWLALLGFASLYPRPDVLSTYFDPATSHWPSLLDDFAMSFSHRSAPQVL